MAFKTTKNFILGAIVAAASVTGIAYAAGGGVESDYKMEHPDWSFNGPFGKYDMVAAQRGYKVYREVCASCHSLKYVAFRHLGDKGAPFYLADFENPNDNPYVKNFAADWTIEDIDNETGDVIERPGITADYFPPIFPNDAAARASNGGAIPPDLSSMVKARNNGADYVYNLMLAYGSPIPKGVEITPGLHWNPVMDGGKIAMAAPLSEGLVDYDPVEINDHGELKTIAAPEATVEQMSHDLVQFLAWSADPKMEQRKSVGLMTLIYLIILSLLLFLSYKRVWRNVKH
ncbi:ubiquinol cytochrome C oxidoreductase [Litorimonas cladophorae]|uniref:Cytochrome c1 n=1 Tax=Litorimonas cladophorae TaxID=1220491 RepID=A0A918KP27_9PROT|nr:cytochrome c1 [Litorimonas cladophorae]GGX71186.1 ubiquinol cytochrome C oxidoreductase [Litorimonas cladophorae]